MTTRLNPGGTVFGWESPDPSIVLFDIDGRPPDLLTDDGASSGSAAP